MTKNADQSYRHNTMFPSVSAKPNQLKVGTDNIGRDGGVTSAGFGRRYATDGSGHLRFFARVPVEVQDVLGLDRSHDRMLLVPTGSDSQLEKGSLTIFFKLFTGGHQHRNRNLQHGQTQRRKSQQVVIRCGHIFPVGV